MAQEQTIFRRYFSDEAFVDRFATRPEGAIDLICPIIHTNELWETNLKSFYREVPVNRLLIGDGGCIDGSLDVARKFPRVVVFEHHSYVSLGFSIRKLIEEVQTDWFAYVHSDVFLPDGWFDAMQKHQSEYDWFGCPEHPTIMVDYMPPLSRARPFAGSQMGRKAAFAPGLARVDDDFVYRQEDFVFVDVVERAGFKHGYVEDMFHYHQTMHRPSRWGRKVERVAVTVNINRDEEIRACNTQVRGMIKYLQPSPAFLEAVRDSILRLEQLDAFDWVEFRAWVVKISPTWASLVTPWWYFRIRWRRMARHPWRTLRGLKT